MFVETAPMEMLDLQFVMNSASNSIPPSPSLAVVSLDLKVRKVAANAENRFGIIAVYAPSPPYSLLSHKS